VNGYQTIMLALFTFMVGNLIGFLALRWATQRGIRRDPEKFIRAVRDWAARENGPTEVRHQEEETPPSWPV
jgi:hypothetical protein